MTAARKPSGAASPVSPRWERWVVATVALIYFALAIGFSLGPIFEAPDEPAHFRLVRNLIQTRALPDPIHRQTVQDHQAPLYYALLIPPTLLLDDGSIQFDLPKNPFWGEAFGVVGNDNKNLRLHSRAEGFPYSGSRPALIIHVLRLMSVIMGALTIVVSYAIFRLLWPARLDRRLLALGIVAFWPQFDWLSGVLNNDNLLILTSTLCLWLLLRQVTQGASWLLAVLLGLALSAALLSKASAVFLAVPVAVAVLLDLRRAWRYAALTLATVLLLAGWWYVRNWQITGSLSGWNPLYETGLIRPGGALALDVALERLPFAYQGLWARFGNVSVPVDQPIYTFFDALLIVALAGAVFHTTRWARRLPRFGSEDDSRIAVQQGLTIAAYILAWLGSLLYLSGTVYTGNQGRYVLPAIAGLGALLAIGLSFWASARIRLRLALSLSALLAAVAAICLFGYYYPAFRPLPLPPSIDRPLSFRFSGDAELIGMSPAAPHGSPGDTITVTLYWKALRASSSSLISFLHSVDSEVVRRDSYPATGNLLSTEWLPGQTWAERYVITLPPTARPQTAYPLIVGLYDAATRKGVATSDATGAPLTPIIGRIAVNGSAAPFAPDYRFGDVIGLGQPDVTRSADQLRVCLKWLSLAATSTDYHIFVHLLAGDGSPLAQADFEPLHGQYPTSVWQPGEAIADCATLNATGLSASGWRIGIGLYDLATGDRLPVKDRGGSDLADNTVILRP